VAAYSEKGSSKPLFEHRALDDGRLFQASVILPKSLPLEQLVGPPTHSKQQARRLASYEACKRLYELGYLSHRFFPRPPILRSYLPDIYANFNVEPDWDAGGKGSKVPNPLGDVTTDASGQVIRGKTAGTRCYVRKRPAFWKNSLQLGFKAQLFITVIDLDLSGITSEKFRIMAILSRHSLPPIAPFKVYYSGYSIEASLLRCEPVAVLEEDLEALLMYTTRVFRTVSGKPVENTLEKTAYFVAPMKGDWKLPTPTEQSQSLMYLPSVADGIAWTEIWEGAKNLATPLPSGVADMEEMIPDAILQDRHGEFVPRFDAVKVRRDLSPLSKPEGIKVYKPTHQPQPRH
jgi:endoribonuclease Dicer